MTEPTTKRAITSQVNVRWAGSQVPGTPRKARKFGNWTIGVCSSATCRGARKNPTSRLTTANPASRNQIPFPSELF